MIQQLFLREIGECMAFFLILFNMTRKKTKIIYHEGVVKCVNGLQVSVLITQSSACSACAAAHLCHSSESREKVIEAWATEGDVPRVGQIVTIQGTVGQGMMAALFAYILPLVLVVGVLFVLNACQMSEAGAAVWTLLSLLPYCGLLYLLRGRLARKLTFQVVTE